ncbi:MAG: hypothetical protein GX967_05555 [Clostridiales bacterium]|nr:hypothetical protein [Clostridiales bacterium]
MGRKPFYNQLIRGYLNLFFSLVLCIMIMPAFVFASHPVIYIILQIFCSVILLGLFANLAWKDAKAEIQIMKYKREEKEVGYRWLVIGILMTIPFYIMLAILIVSKLGYIGNVMPIYKVLNAQFLPLIALIAPDADVAKMAWYSVIIFAILPLTIPITTHLSFKISYKDKVNLEKIMYEDQ